MGAVRAMLALQHKKSHPDYGQDRDATKFINNTLIKGVWMWKTGFQFVPAEHLPPCPSHVYPTRMPITTLTPQLPRIHPIGTFMPILVILTLFPPNTQVSLSISGLQSMGCVAGIEPLH